jgi:uncharacterized protein YyaL (SSP411 family)
LRLPLHGTLLLLLLGFAGCDSCGKTLPATSDADGGLAVASRSPAQIRKEGNHLKGQSSLYLREHAHNPVDWYPWTPEALERAKTLDRPIFLSIGYSSCHWCHVMAAEVFEDDEVAALLNDTFVAIKVDREERPDVDATYMDVVQTLTGSGGWPSTVFLTPQLKPFFGGTYFPKERFLDVVRRAVKELKENRGAVENRGSEVAARIAAGQEAGRGDRSKVRVGELQAMTERSLDGVDLASGGMKGRTKFPSPARWTLLLHAARKWGAPFTEPLRRTLDAMATGGLYDHVGGGFFRYTVDAAWTVPHFEKMLYVNASLARLYLEAYAAFGEARDLAVARGTLDFLLAEMRAPDGLFCSSLDADSGGKEGSFYVFTAAELRTLFGAEGDAVVKLVGATEAGNFDGANVLSLRSPEAAKLDSRKWKSIQDKLAAARAKRVRPARDEKVVTSWNGLAIDAFARAFVATGDLRYRDAAKMAADRLWTAHRGSGRLLRSTTAGKGTAEGMLDDYASFSYALVTLAQSTGDLGALRRAVELANEMEDGFAHPDGGFYGARAGGPLERRVDLYDSEEPCGPALAIATTTRIAALTGRADLYASVDKALEAGAGSARRSGVAMASWLDAALLESGPFYDVVIAGTPNAAGTEVLASTWRALSPPWAVHTDVDAAGASPEMLALLPALEGKTAHGGAATAYVCVKGACRAPTSDPATFRKELLDGWMR